MKELKRIKAEAISEGNRKSPVPRAGRQSGRAT
jgi:hypothetical protein